MEGGSSHALFGITAFCCYDSLPSLAVSENVSVSQLRIYFNKSRGGCVKTNMPFFDDTFDDKQMRPLSSSWFGKREKL